MRFPPHVAHNSRRMLEHMCTQEKFGVCFSVLASFKGSVLEGCLYMHARIHTRSKQYTHTLCKHIRKCAHVHTREVWCVFKRAGLLQRQCPCM